DQELCQLGKTPSVEGTTLLLAVFAAVSNPFEIFEGKRIACLHGSQNLVCNPMVLCSLKPFPTTRRSFQMSFRVFSAFGLQERAQMFVLPDAIAQALGGEELGFGGNGNTLDTQITSNDIAVR